MPEPYDGKLSRTVLRREGGSNASDLSGVQKQRVVNTAEQSGKMANNDEMEFIKSGYLTAILGNK